MMKYQRKLVCALFLVLLSAAASLAHSQAPASPSTTPTAAGTSAPAPAKAQSPASPQAPAQPAGQKPGEFTIPISVNEVYLIFTVTDSKGHFIKDLQLSDFALLDDQKAPAQVFSFQQQTNLPLRVGLLIDTSTSIRRRFEFEQQAATEFVLNTIHPRSDRAFVMGFDVAPDLKQDWTNDLDLLESGINALRPGGGTALYDAVYTACRDKLADSARGQEPTRKALVLVSDGNDNQSRVYLDEAIKMCQRADTIVYAISTNTSPTQREGRRRAQEDIRRYRRYHLHARATGRYLQRFPRRLGTSFAVSMRSPIARQTSRPMVRFVPSICFATSGAIR